MKKFKNHRVIPKRSQKRFFKEGYLFIVFLFLFNNNLSATTITSLSNTNPFNQLPDGGFENPAIPLGTCVPAANNANWAYIGNAKIASNGSPCSSLNPNAPEGTQVLAIVNGGSASTTLNLLPGVYRLSLKAALQQNISPYSAQSQDVEVKIDGKTVYKFKRDQHRYALLKTPVFILETGNETIEIIADCCYRNAAATLIDDIRVQALPLWSDPTTWDSNTVPTAQDDVIIPEKSEIVFDVDAQVKSIHLKGQFYALLGRDLNLSLDYFLVDGSGALLEWGRENQPYLNRGIINLTGNNLTQDIMNMGTKFIGALNSGRIEIHGKPRLSWTQLNATATEGSQTITVKEPTDWQVGDQLVIASTDYDVHQCETIVISSISNNGQTFGFSTPLANTHFGVLQYYDNGTRVLDERAEVGLLTRNITIQGVGRSAQNGFGGHTIIRGNAEGRISGVELYHMGQKGELGRYPFHWHHAHDASGQYIKNSSIHSSFNRVVTVHRTNNALIKDNVGYDHIGHGYFLEDASEVGNVFDHNLGLKTRKPAPGEAVRPHDRVQEGNINMFKLPATFWITNPANDFINNAAAGSEGSGFWMTAQNAVISGPPISTSPKNNPMGQFDNNRGHSNDHSNFAVDGQVITDGNGQENFVFGHYEPMLNGQQHIPVINNFTSFKARSRGLWTRANTMYFDHCALAGNNTNTFFAFSQVLRHSLSVGASNNSGKIETTPEIAAGRSLAFDNLPVTHNRNAISGHVLYDGTSGIEDVHFANFLGTSNGTFCIGISGAARKSPIHWSNNISFEPGIPENAKVNFNLAPHYDNVFSTGLIDRDGTILGTANKRLVPKIRFLGVDDPLAVRESGFNTELGDPENTVWNAVTTDNLNVATIYWRNFWPQGEFSPSYFMRFDGPPTAIFGPSYATLGDHAVGQSIHQPSVLTDAPRTYYWQYQRLPNRSLISLQFAEQNDRMISAFPNIPSSLYVRYNTGGGAVTKATGFFDLMNSPQEKYFIKDNTLYINHLANEGGVDPKYGHDHSHKSKLIKLCLEQNCSNNVAGLTDGVVFADFETGINGKSTVQGNGLPNPAVSTSVTNPNTAPFDNIDDYVSYQVVSDGDGVDDYIEFTMSFTRQIWTHFDHLKVHLDGAPIRVYLKNGGNPLTYLGKHTPVNGVATIPLTSLVKNQRDHARKLHIRIYESDLGNINVPGITALIKLYHIGLGVNTGTFRNEVSNEATKSTFLLDKGLSIYPNPTSKEFRLSTKIVEAAPIYVSIYNMLGAEIFQWEGNAAVGEWSKQFSTETWNLKAGVYNVLVRTSDKQFNCQLILTE